MGTQSPGERPCLRRMWRRYATDRAFSSIELMVVLVIMGIVTAVAIPTYSSWLPTSRVNGAARELFTELQLARMRAISENHNVAVTFDVSNSAFSTYDDDDNDFAAAGVETGEFVKTVRIRANFQGVGFGVLSSTGPGGESPGTSVTFPGTPPRVIFMPTGLVEAVGSAYLVPSDGAGLNTQRAVTVALTGRVKLWKHTGSAWE